MYDSLSRERPSTINHDGMLGSKSARPNRSTCPTFTFIWRKLDPKVPKTESSPSIDLKACSCSLMFEAQGVGIGAQVRSFLTSSASFQSFQISLKVATYCTCRHSYLLCTYRWVSFPNSDWMRMLYPVSTEFGSEVQSSHQ